MSGSMSRRQAIEAVTTYDVSAPGFTEPLADTERIDSGGQ